MTKLSQLPQDSSPSVNDFLAGYAVSGPTTQRFKVSDIINLAIATGFNPHKFSVYRNAAFTAGTGPDKIQFDTKIFDTGTDVDVVTNHRFVAPVNGFYFFNAFCNIASVTSGSFCQLYIYKNGSTIIQGQGSLQGGTSTNFTQGVTAAGFLQLSATDYIEVYVYGSGFAGGASSTSNGFQGYLVSAT